jgi:hypothetical protein
MLHDHQRAKWLDDQADRHLSEGRHGVAERLSHAAADLRNSSRLLAYHRGAQHLHDCGARATFEFLLELGEVCGCAEKINEMLIEWRRTDPEWVRYLGGGKFPRTLQEVPAE